MATEGNRNKQAVWRDITPAQPSLKTPSRKNKRLSLLIIRFKTFMWPFIKRLPKTRRKTIKLIIAMVCLVGIVLIGAGYIIHSKQNANNQAPDQSAAPSIKSSSQPPGLIKGTPAYSVLLPANKNITASDGWVRPGDKSVFVYIDTINNITVSVSEQPLPDDFQTDTSQQMEQLARAEKANEKITVGTTTVYIGKTAKGPQSIFFTRNNLLILIKSDDLITNDQWAAYINSLQ